jgi:hypothetical protein
MQMACDGRGRSSERHGGWKKAETVPLAIYPPPNETVEKVQFLGFFNNVVL